MDTRSTLLVATALVFAVNAMAAPVAPFAPGRISRAIDSAGEANEPWLILVQNCARGGGGGQRSAGGGGQRSTGAANRGNNFNSNNFHRDVSNSRTTNVNTSRSANVNANRNVNVSGSGGCCYGNYNSGPNWGGVAAA